MFTDPRITSLNIAQLIYCVQQFALDDKEEWEAARDRAEYMAMFINSDAVKEIQKRRRDQAEGNTEENEKVFEEFVQSEFGTPPDIDEITVIQPIGDGTIKSSFGVNPEDHVPESLKKRR